MSKQPLPLSGIRVLEFTHAVMGPSAGIILADLGAEVIRVEPAPEGDHTRRLKGFGTGYYTYFNRNKKSLAVNLKTEEGQAVVARLLVTVDALIENFAPGTMERLGLGYPAVAQQNPRLVYCRLKGFMEGPYAKRTALDEVVQMMSGLAYMTGPPGQPLRAGASIVDIMGGAFGALSILVALRERDVTGEGQLVETGLFETAAYIMGQHMTYAALAREPIPPMPARVSAWAIYRLFSSADGDQVFVGVTSDRHWESFCQAFERPDLLADPTLATNSDRINARERLLPDLERMFAGLSRAEIVARCETAGIPFSPIARPEDLFDDPQLNEGDSLLEAQLPDGRRARLPKLPLALSARRFDIYQQAPAVGEHTRDLLQDLGYSHGEIQALHDAGVIVAPSQSVQ
ncbi:MAG: CoA transferase [Caldilineaceae bacterium]|nr:CoA transferase [Caldilineaceae bacterium]